MALTDDDRQALRRAAGLLRQKAPLLANRLGRLAGPSPERGPRDLPEPLRRFIADLPPAPPWGLRPIPRVIWQFWHAGLEGAPDVVQRSVTTWRHFNPDHDHRLLSLADVNALFGFDFDEMCTRMTVDLGWAGKSDLLRMMLLAKYGGIWADATTFCLHPLDNWLHKETRENGFFCFRHTVGHNDHELVSWLMAGTPGHRVSVDLLRESAAYVFAPRDKKLLLRRKKLLWPAFGLEHGARPAKEFLETCAKTRGWVPYFWLHYLYQEVMSRFPRERTYLAGLSNRGLQDKVPLKDLAMYDVTKQTFRRDPETDPTYRQRVELLFDGEKVRSDTPGRSTQPCPVPNLKTIQPAT